MALHLLTTKFSALTAHSWSMCAEITEQKVSLPKPVCFKGPNTGNFTWNITDKKLIQNILNASNKQLFESEPFTMANLRWIIQLHPNGDDQNAKGSVNVFVKLLSMPPGLSSITFARIISCKQTFASSMFIKKLTKSENQTGWPDRFVLLSEWSALNLRQRTKQMY